MALLELYIGQSKFTIDCEEHQKSKITTLASKINKRVNKLSLQMRGADEKTILMLCSIMIEEELESAKSVKIVQQDQNHLSQDNQTLKANNNIEKSIAENIENISVYIESLANKIKND